MSMQELAEKCGFSKAYVSLLEKGINPKTKKPFSPTIQTFEKIARATGYDVDSLIKILDSTQPVTITAKPVTLNYEDTKLLRDFHSLTADGKTMLLGVLNSLRVTHSVSM
ncbi:MAG: helix-turn-helix transcriptional regulator [Selenomonadaceae bacterium]|nr:helix-turn-helix transcriptional regulator [Selenomonadaceae bacterium]